MPTDTLTDFHPAGQSGGAVVRRRSVSALDAPDLPAVLNYFFDGIPCSDRHRNYLPIFRRKPDGITDIGSFTLLELDNAVGHGPAPWLPGLLKAIDIEAYFGLHPMFRAGRRFRRRTIQTPARDVPLSHPTFGNVAIDFPNAVVDLQVTTAVRRNWRGFRFVFRRSDGARFFTHCAVDIDWHDAPAVGRAEQIGRAVGAIVTAYHQGDIPQPSMVLHSGRGVWCFWKLLDERNPAQGTRLLNGILHEPGTACRASRLALERLDTINHVLVSRLADCGRVEFVDAAKGVRVPGSLNRLAHQRVVLELWSDASGAVPAYTLSDLAGFLKIDALTPYTRHTHQPSALTAAQVEQLAGARAARHRKIFDGILKLAALRGGIMDGDHRHFALMYLARAGYRAGLPAATVNAAAHRFGATCRPPLSKQQVQTQLGNARRAVAGSRKPPKTETIVADLHVTGTERAAIGWVRRPASCTRRTTHAARLALIHDIINRAGYFSQNTMRAELARAGLTASQQTISRDYERLGIWRPVKLPPTPTNPPTLPL